MLDISVFFVIIWLYFVIVVWGLEAIVVQELIELGVEQVKLEFVGVVFIGDWVLLYCINFWFWLIYWVLMFMVMVKVFNVQDLYCSIKKIDWDEYFSFE